MKYAILCVIMARLAITGSAQINITHNDLPGPGESYTYKTLSFPFGNVDVTTTGPNQMWDFSTLVGDSVEVVEYVSSSQTPYAFYFSNLFGTKLADTQVIGQGYAFTDVYLFFDKDNGAYTAEGLGFTFSQAPFPLAAFYTDKDTIYHLPLAYGDTDTSTFRFYLGIPTIGSYSQTGTRITEVDGWGTVQTPAGTYSCLRVVSETDQMDTLALQGQGAIGIPIQQRTIQWLTDQDKVPVLEVTQAFTLNQWTTTGVRYRDQMTGITSAKASSFTVFPNPASNQIQVRWEGPLAPNEIWVVDAMGRTVFDEIALSTGPSISIAEWPNGLYFVSIRSGDEWTTKALQITRE